MRARGKKINKTKQTDRKRDVINHSYLIHKLLDPHPQLIHAVVGHGRESLVDAGGGGASDVGDQVREVLGRLELDLARRVHRRFFLVCFLFLPSLRF